MAGAEREAVANGAGADLEGRFYRGSLSAEEQESYDDALAMDGLAEEIALLRVKLNTAAKEQPTDMKLMVAGIGLLVRAVGTQYRLSPKVKKELTDSMAAVLNSLGDLILPAER